MFVSEAWTKFNGPSRSAKSYSPWSHKIQHLQFVLPPRQYKNACFQMVVSWKQEYVVVYGWDYLT